MAIAVSFWTRAALAQFSPGELSRAHAAFDGATECFKCHEPRKATTADRCLACHHEIGTRITAQRGFHGQLDPGKRLQCGSCHAEHGGATASIVRWPGGNRQAFDHRQAGFALLGRHARLRCEQCHKPELVRAEDIRASKQLRLETTSLGLPTRCADCHTDVHRGQFAARVEASDCSSCHGTEGWKPARFEHATSRFPLAGKHAGVVCARCHASYDAAGVRVDPGTPGSVVRYRPLPFESCTACHADPHQNRFGAECAQCHTTEGWKQLAPGSFDHSRTRFALQGRHARVACTGCHWSESAAGQRVPAGTAGAKPRYKPLRFAACSDCHTDPHANRFGPTCTQCHTMAGWRELMTGGFDHDRTRYPLRGRHARLECRQCHRTDAAKRTLAFQKCTDCHADAHRGQLALRPDGGACEVCHDVEGFTPAHFGVLEHAATDFKLEGGHRAVACVACHRPKVGAAPNSFDFHFESQNCAACHRDPHAGQFTEPVAASDRADSAAKLARTTACERCHTATAWRSTVFDHDRSRFRLEGAHRRIACAACHRPMMVAGRSVVQYRPLDTACRACHAEPMRPLGK